MRIFISHAWEDKEFALALFQLPEFIKPWIDSRELTGGQELDSAITIAIDESHLFIILVSRYSQEKNWVQKELSWALEREAQKDRVFVLPLVIDAEVILSDSPSPINQLANRLNIDGSDQSTDGMVSTREAVINNVFRWASDWIETVEPKGDSGARFVQRVEETLLDYQTCLFSIKALLAWPLEVLAREESKKLMIQSQATYSELTEQLLPALITYENEIRWRFGVSTQKAFVQLGLFIRNDVFHGAAYAMNDIVESVNAFNATIQHDTDKLEQARAIQTQRVDALDEVLKNLIRRTAEFISTIK